MSEDEKKEREDRKTVLRIEKGKEHSLQIADNILDPNALMYPAYERALMALMFWRKRGNILPCPISWC